jgi:hypothetical protein
MENVHSQDGWDQYPGFGFRASGFSKIKPGNRQQTKRGKGFTASW